MNTRVQLTEALEALNHDILAMGTRVEEDLRKALQALKTADTGLAREVKADDAAVNAMQVAIEDKAAMLIATQQPVAGDLRRLVTVFRFADNLERIGDHAVHLAKAVIKLSGSGFPRPVDRLERMADAGCSMLRDAVDAFVKRDAALARATAARDDGIDAEHKAFVEEVIGFMCDHADKAREATKLIQTSSYLERLGDHVTNLCEAVVFMAEGSHVELND